MNAHLTTCLQALLDGSGNLVLSGDGWAITDSPETYNYVRGSASPKAPAHDPPAELLVRYPARRRIAFVSSSFRSVLTSASLPSLITYSLQDHAG